MAYRRVFQTAQAVIEDPRSESQDQNFCGNIPQRSFDSDLDSSYSNASLEVVALHLQSRLVILQPCCHAAHEPLYLQGLTQMAGGSIWFSANRTCPRTTFAGAVNLGQLKFSTYRKTPERRPGQEKYGIVSLSCYPVSWADAIMSCFGQLWYSRLCYGIIYLIHQQDIIALQKSIKQATVASWD